ncbi:hypothetical protein ANN_15807 [Periplaneta americana]|uniref:Uncharacterized protein n=1 Tax=Periplaneta americana TaxID=6978 RepID=A0ABQ8SHH2_PERAM|nr:hypothetical protein ANN_15807 [Periplaneta americana]
MAGLCKGANEPPGSSKARKGLAPRFISNLVAERDAISVFCPPALCLYIYVSRGTHRSQLLPQILQRHRRSVRDLRECSENIQLDVR